MNWLIRALSSSVGKKFVMAITGLLLCGFLVVHLAGNVLLYVGPEAYNAYAHKLHSQEGLIKIAEVGLAALFGLHIFLAISLTRANVKARDVEYLRNETKLDDPNPRKRASNWMGVTGLVILGFLLLHLTDFTIEARDFEYEGKEPFDKAIMILKNPITAGVYLVGCAALLIHLLHGFASAFQSLGLKHPKVRDLINRASWIFAFAIGFGFASFLVWAFLQ
ncbi:MAG: succinate dehydrogenase cytochrome b subunit [Planctomycetaceae bacterium]